MATDDNLQNLMTKVAEQLLRRTLAGDISWAETDKEDDYLYSGSDSSASIYFSRRSGSVRGRYVLTVFNSRGTRIEELRSDYVRTNEGVIEEAGWNGVLSELHEAARRNALDIEGVLDDLIAELSKEQKTNSQGGGETSE